jgi:hypothetical protein
MFVTSNRSPDAHEHSTMTAGWSEAEEVDPTPAALTEVIDRQQSKEHRQLIAAFYNPAKNKAVLLFGREQMEANIASPPKSK